MKVQTESASLAYFQLTTIMFALALFIDAVNGFFLSGIGLDLKLSAIYKLLLVVIVLAQIGSFSLKVLKWVLILLVVFSIGSSFKLIETSNATGFIEDFTTSLKIITPFIFFVYFALCAERWPELVIKYGKRILMFSFYVLLMNLILGGLGFGFSSYGNGGSDSEDGIGIKGFFYAGNEVSGVFIILFGAMLHFLWQKNRLIFFFFSILTILAGVLVATKAAMAAAVLLVFLIPLTNDKNRLFNLTWLKVKMVFPLVLVTITLSIVLLPLLESTGLLERFMWFYEKKGIVGIIFSGRDEFVIEAAQVFEKFANITDVLFGFGRSGLALLTKDSMEVDPIDMYLWFGIPGLLMFVFTVTVFMRVSYLATKIGDSEFGACVLVINILLFGVSIIAGHILTSGMLAPLLGLLNGLAYADIIYSKQKAST